MATAPALLEPRRASAWPAAAAAVWALLFAGSSAYWAAGGMLGSETVAKDLAERAVARDPGFVATLWAAAALKASLAVLAVALTRPWGARSGRILRIAGWTTGAALTVYGAFGLAEFGLMAVGALDIPAEVGRAAVAWYVFLWEPIWLLGGLLFLATARAAPRSRVFENRRACRRPRPWRVRRRAANRQSPVSSPLPANVQRPGGRRRLRRLAISVLVLAALTLIGVGWARLSTNTSTLARALIWREADVGDQHRFPAGSIRAGGHASALPVGPQARIWVAAPDAAHGRLVLDDVLRDSDTRAFVVVDHGRIVYQRYYEGSDERTLETSFSVAKSFVSTLVGIAIDEGRIGDVRDPVTDYIPELAARDPHFERISLRDLLTMSSGLRYEESPFPLPWGDDTYTYYGVDLRKEALQRTEIEHKPGENWHYNNYNALLLGLVLERATGMSVRDYMASRLWRPLGAASNASWSLDSDRSGFEKMESGLNATALDYARFGLLWLHGGSWNHNRILPRNWVDAATRVQTVTDYDNPYGYFWWIDGEYPQRFYAFGNYGQYVYVAPDAGLVVVRLGSDWGLDNDAWLRIFRDLADNRDGQPGSSPLASEAVWTWAPTAAEIR